MKGNIFNIQKYSIHDGPGIRTTVFFKGCPLKCQWCHNPESQNFNKEVMFFKDKCIECGFCLKVCKNNALYFEENSIKINTDKCNICGDCCEECPTTARSMVGEEKSCDDVLKEILKDKIFYDESGGGVTFSGGEPLSQGEFLKTLLIKCKNKGINTTVDTSGFGDKELIEDIATYVDLFLYDLKIIDNEKHKKYIGVSNEIILNNLKALKNLNKRVFIRIPIIPTINDGNKDIDDFITTLKNIGVFEQINLLPYHNISSEKYRRLNKKYELTNINVPSDEKMEEIKKIFENEGFKVKIGG